MKKMLVILLLMTLCLGQLVPATAESTNLQAQLAGNYFTYAFVAEGYGEYVYYFHFYDEVPVLGSVFYAGFSNNQMNFAGTYTVEEKEYAYACNPDREAATNDGIVNGTAPYTVTFYDWAGNVLDDCGFDGSILYNDMTTLSASGSSPLYYLKDEAPDQSKYLMSYENEQGVNYLSFVSPEDETCTVQLSHNGTYVDLTSYIIEGKWEMTRREDGGYDYALTPDDNEESPVGLSVSVDQKTAVYTAADGTVMELMNAEADAALLLYTGSASQTIAAMGTDANFILNLYDDGACELVNEIFGNTGVLDSGSYTFNADYSVSFEFEKAGELTAALNMETRSNVLNYKLTHEALGEIDVEIALGKAETPQATPAVLFSFVGGYTALDIYDDGTYQFSFESYGLKETGTWAFDSAAYAFTLTQGNGNVIAATIDGETHALTLEYVAEANEQLKDTFSAEASVWGSALVK